MAQTFDIDGSTSNSISERQEKKKKKDIKTPDNFNYGDMPAGFRRRYKQMLNKNKK